ncbi:hypothetical protein COCSUDRAFT_47203 [Coccomyxa subellipsoidea C-169]|uniref:CBF1-interacting co-repressor CIR N-terminal domain-containing protein n=1 Tax=Coccomyxa subellipsoidea (strain C-169) TaxID=574566 RepID=I0Z0S5_COCSC|nr:hypothetical protein COCSUDRAFT_47203 [Coccomyxa subellipsoidea C-169]EIE24244.1 hypothetical protein COCSUDRAFT_47203 [Coccomyxa subellipsoidea C-169]|eukprot:XP_005648788.1 hypothetical protein COCSUDRAFT_47203 [Coccomyxa subellipsoidea C-169]
MAPKHKEPARGALAGMKADVDRAKQAALLGEDYNPAIPGVGAAWSHNFLNQKPWHPLNYRNQLKVYEAQQQAESDAKAKAVGKAEFDAEQEYLKTLSYLSAEDQQKYRDRQGVSFMYQKPPGYDAAMSKAAEQNAEAEKSEAAAEAPQQEAPSQQEGRRERPQAGLPKEYVANMLGAISALHQHEKYEVRHVSGGGQRSPPRGGFDITASNQQLLVDEPDEDIMVPGASGLDAESSDSSDSEQHRKRKKLKQAEAYLKAAGIDHPFKSSGKKDKKKKLSKKYKKDKKSRKDR